MVKKLLSLLIFLLSMGENFHCVFIKLICETVKHANMKVEDTLLLISTVSSPLGSPLHLYIFVYLYFFFFYKHRFSVSIAVSKFSGVVVEIVVAMPFSFLFFFF